MKRALAGALSLAVILGSCAGGELDVPSAPTSPPGVSSALHFRDPETCRSCHADHVAEWEGSMHAYAMTDPIFHAVADIQAFEFDGEAGQFCTQCHSPPGFLGRETGIERTKLGAYQKTEGLSRVAQSGVSCDVCHSVTQVLKPSNANLLFEPGVMRGPFGDAMPTDAHASAESPLHRSGNLCVACHDVLLPFAYKDVKLEQTGAEWESYIANGGDKQCQDCHMPTRVGRAAPGAPERTLHAHTFVGADLALVDFPDKPRQAALVAKLMSEALDLSVADAPKGTTPGFVVTLRSKTGHAIPSGVTTERRVWIEATVTDAGGARVYQTGMLDPNGDLMDGAPEHTSMPLGDPDLWFFGSTVTFGADKGKHRVAFPHQADAIEGHLLPPLGTEARTYALPGLASGTYALHVRVLFRAVQPHFLRSIEKHIAAKGFDPTLKTRIPILTMAEQTRAIVVP